MNLLQYIFIIFILFVEKEDDYLYPNQMACPRIARDYDSWPDNEVEF